MICTNAISTSVLIQIILNTSEQNSKEKKITEVSKHEQLINTELVSQH